jgi:hypothetical protein
MSNTPTTLDSYDVAITPLKSGGRMDVVVSDANRTPGSFTSTDIVDQFRAFFDRLALEAEAHAADPIAMVNALARMEALLADVRYVTAEIRKHTADALNAEKVRRITVEGVATMEASSTSERTDWQDRALLLAMLERSSSVPNVDYNTGEIVDHGPIADEILSWVRVQWRLTPIRDAGLDPDDYSQQPTNEDGTPLRTPTVTVKDNRMRVQQVASGGRRP